QGEAAFQRSQQGPGAGGGSFAEDDHRQRGGFEAGSRAFRGALLDAGGVPREQVVEMAFGGRWLDAQHVHAAGAWYREGFGGSAEDGDGVVGASRRTADAAQGVEVGVGAVVWGGGQQDDDAAVAGEEVGGGGTIGAAGQAVGFVNDQQIPDRGGEALQDDGL